MKLLSKIATGISIFAVCITVGSVSAGTSVLAKAPLNAAATQTTTAPETPGNFRLEKRTGNQLRFNWDWVAGGVGAIHYELSYVGRTVVLNQYYPGYTQDVSNLDLSPGHTYTFNLRAVDEVGNRSAVPAQLVFETTPPSSPSNLTQISTKMGYPDLITFMPARDNASPIRVYEVFLNGKSFGIIGGSISEFSLFKQVFESYLAPPVGPVALQLRAYDSSFNASSFSTPLTVVFP